MLLTVIVPIYNVEKYLDKCVQSIVNQTYHELEIILVDDGSTDSSGQLCDAWSQRDERIRVIHKMNGGLSSARNAGLDVVQGEFVAFVDSDDFIECDMYKTMLEALMKSGKDIACCGRIVDLWGKREKEEFCISSLREMTKEEAMVEVLCLHDMDVSACDKVYRMKIFDSIRYPEGKISEDAAVIMQVLETANGVIHVGQPFYHYIFREKSISKEAYTHRKYDAYENCKQILTFVKKYNPGLERYAKIYGAQVCANLLESMYASRSILHEYQEDFIAYRKMFNAGFGKIIRSDKFSHKLKVRFLFIWIGMPEVFWLIKKICRK